MSGYYCYCGGSCDRCYADKALVHYRKSCNTVNMCDGKSRLMYVTQTDSPYCESMTPGRYAEQISNYGESKRAPNLSRGAALRFQK